MAVPADRVIAAYQRKVSEFQARVILLELELEALQTAALEPAE